jgi:hypothetical protein
MSAGDSLKPLEAELAALLAPFKTEINEALAVRYLCRTSHFLCKFLSH